jgi:Pyruvate/2-oxoacid:ferredoxin oxidoreductase delta subunit
MEKSLSITNGHEHLSLRQKIYLTIGVLGLIALGLGWINPNVSATMILWLFVIFTSVGVIGFAYESYRFLPEGIKNNGVWFKSVSGRGVLAWLLAIVLTSFYILLYWYPEYLGLHATQNTGLIRLFDPLSFFLKGQKASEWFVYGVFYTLSILVFGVKFIWKYRHNRYQRNRTLSIMFFQTIFAFLLPEILISLNLPFNDFKNIWPLNYYFFFDWHIQEMLHNGTFGLFMLYWGIASILIFTPVLTYFYGKRWYCSWVCGCGGLAETTGDAFRQLSSKSLTSWKIERYLIHFVLVFAVLMTAMVLYTQWTHQATFLFFNSYLLSKWYGFFIGAAFSGVIGVGFYPLLGTRVWCRFGCPQAAILGIFQKYFSRFRITTNGGQCISCGNCSTYCEMGIDVKSYAQKGQDIVRASCVGCGICSAVCPRGVLKLENGSVDFQNRASQTRTVHIPETEVGILKDFR